jgi:hypothetical protein
MVAEAIIDEVICHSKSERGMQVRWVMIFVALAGASAQGKPGNGGGFAGDMMASSGALPMSDAGLRPAPSDESGLRYFPLRNYRRFPLAIRPLLQRADMEQDHCRGSTDRDPEKYRACNRSWRIMRELERRGWCWGSERRSRASADEHWLRCSRDPTYRGDNQGPRPPFSEREIRQMTGRAPH